MGTPAEETSLESTEEVQSTTSDQGNTPGQNPAWNEVLSLLPEQFHGPVTQHFQKWDQAANSRIEAANAKVKEFESYAPFVEHGIDFDTISNGLNLMHTLNNDPQQLYDALRETYGLTHKEAAEAVQEVSEEVADESTPNPKLQQLEEGFNVLAQAYLTDQEAKRTAEVDAWTESQFAEAKKKYGDFDEGYVMDRIVAKNAADEDYTVDEAVQDYQKLVSSIVESNPRPFAPRVLGGTSGGGSGLPSQATDVTKLSDSDTKKLVEEMARRHAQQT